jgi:hypothetical protein
MPEVVDSLEEGWVPLATRIAELLEEELASLAGSFRLDESREEAFRVGDRVRSRKPSREERVHAGGIPLGTIKKVHDDGTYDVKWDELAPPPRADSDWEPEDTDEPHVPGSRLMLSTSKKGSRKDHGADS